MDLLIGKKTVSNVLARFAVQNVEQHGLPLATFLQYTGFQLDELEVEGGRVPAHKQIRMLRYGEALFPRDTSALLDMRTALELFPDLFALVGNCRNLESAIAAFLHCKDIIAEIDQIRFTKTAKGFEIDYFDESGIERSLSAFAFFVLVISVIRHYLPTSRFGLSVELTRPMFSAASFDSHTQAIVHFSRPRNRLTCTTDGLATPYPVYNDMLNGYVWRRINAQLERIRESHSFASKIERCLRDAIWQKDVVYDVNGALDQICARFCMSRWTVLRKLKCEGDSFKGLYARLRLSEACKMLSDTQIGLAEISAKLGFSSQSAFSRFFKTNHGTPPACYRKEKRLARR